MYRFGRQTDEYGYVNFDLSVIAIPFLLDVKWTAIVDSDVDKGTRFGNTRLWQISHEVLDGWWVDSAITDAILDSAPYLATVVDKPVSQIKISV
jgi:hypothetical protein